MNKPLAYTYFIAGIIFCVCLYLIMQRSVLPVLTRSLLVAGYFIAIIFWRWIEKRLHKGHIQLWKHIRQNGKLTFIVTRYILLRGIILILIFIVPSYSAVNIQAIMMFVILFISLTSILGNQEWSDCENQYQATLLHDAATSLRVIQN